MIKSCLISHESMTNSLPNCSTVYGATEEFVARPGFNAHRHRNGLSGC